MAKKTLSQQYMMTRDTLSTRILSTDKRRNILRMEGANSCIDSGGNIVSRISDNTGISESHDSFVFR